ncbi:MAG TPA: DUF2917 domain-containing protein [Burkholderiales bacterium]|jgi:hypothetical protein
MNHEYAALGAVSMTRGSILRIEDGRDRLIYVWEGELWLTQEGDGRDRCLGPGSWFRLDRKGVAVAQAIRRSTVTLSAKAGEPLGARLTRFWTGLFAPHARPTTAAL